MKPHRIFNETRTPRDLDPLDGKASTEFPYEDVFRNIDGVSKEITGPDWEGMGTALKKILRFVTRPVTGFKGQSGAKWEKAVFKRTIALLWSIDPGYFESSPSLRKLSKRIGVRYKDMKTHTSKTRKQFATRNRHQAHAWNFKPHKNGVAHHR